jgi:hypothetical protein
VSLDKPHKFPVGAQEMGTKARRLTRPQKNKKLDVKRRLLGKWQTHPVDRLVKIANFIETQNPEFAGKIWIRLLDACVEEDRKIKSSLPPITERTDTPIETDPEKLLEDLENGTGSGDCTSVAERTAPLQVEAGAAADLQGNTR